MNQHNQLATHAVSPAPTAMIPKLSFCKTTARDLAAWLLTLPKANTGEYSRQLYLALTELSKLQANPELRAQLLEQLRPEVALITKQLEKNHLIGNVILDARATKVAKLCLALQHLLSNGYRQVALDLKNKKGALLVLAIQRTLHGLLTTLAHCYLTYRDVPSGLWLEAHQMYRLAAHHGLLQHKAKDPQLESTGEQQTLEQAYCCILLLGAAPTNQMRQADIKALHDALPKWCTMAKLLNIDNPLSLFAILLTSDTPPRYRALLKLDGHSNVLGLSPHKLLETITEALKARENNAGHPLIDARLSTQLLHQLASAWTDIAKRYFVRQPATGTLELCLGMSSVHYHLAGEQSFEKTLDQPLSETTLELVPTEPSPQSMDVWASAVDAFQEATDSASTAIDYKPHGQEEPEDIDTHDYASMYPVLQAVIVNQSAGGYCLEWATPAPANLQTGDILALRHSSNEKWAIGLIRWIRQNGQAGVQTGIMQLSHRADPCAIQLLRSGKAASNYLRALLVPAVGAIARPPRIITATIPFREGSTVLLNQSGEENRALLGKLVQQSACCSLFEYEIMQQAAKSPAAPASADSKAATAPDVRAKVGESEDFSSLWELL